MIGTTGATVLLIANSVLAALPTWCYAVGGGGLKAALIDAAIALVVVALAAYVVAAIEAARGVWGSRATLV